MRFVKFFAALVILLVVGFAGWRALSSWRTEQDRLEAAQAPQGPLPRGLAPTHYDLSLRIDPDLDVFSGRVEIDVVFDRAVDEFFLHGERIEVDDAVLVLSDEDRLELEYHEMGQSGVARLRSPETIPVGSARLEIDYEAPFDTTLEALYIVEADGLRYAFTQLEPIAARQVFPSFDEPRFKVPFDLTLEVREEHAALTATPERHRETLGDGFVRIEYERTRPLPTYLLAFAVGPLDIVEADPIPPNEIRERPIPLRGAATAGKGEQLAFALDNTADLVLELERYFEIPYPYRKLDIAAVPDFSFGAMENVGLITYRETRLLLGDQPSARDLRGFANTHAHELAHQWFGNLVTMPWWDDIWLNESFATWMGNRVADRVHPGLEFGAQTVREGHWVMASDVYSDSRRVREEVAGRDEIASSFDWISYAKGGAFLGMMESWLSPERFQKGIQLYLRRHAWENATIDDFLTALSQTSEDRPIVPVARSFLEQRGVPEVSVDFRCEAGTTTVELSQSRHLEMGSSIDPEQSWTQPLCLRLLGDGIPSDDAPHCVVIDGGKATTTIHRPACPAAILPNVGGAGYTRFVLERGGYRPLLSRLEELSPAEKFSVANNLSAAFRAGRLSASEYLEQVPAIVRQPEWDVATEPIGTLVFIADYLADASERAALAEYVAELYQGHLATAPAEDGSDTGKRLLRSRVGSMLVVNLEAPSQVERMADIGVRAIGYGGEGGIDLSVVEGDQLGTALSAAILREGEPFFEALVDAVDASKDLSFREKGLRALGATRDPELSARLRSPSFLLSLKLNEMPMILYSQANAPGNLPEVYDWVERFFPWSRNWMPERYVAETPGLARGFCDRASRDRVEAFFAPYAEEIPGLGLELSQTLEEIELCEALVSSQAELRIPGVSAGS